MGTPAPDIGVAMRQMRQLVILLSLGLAVRAFDNAMQWLTDDLFNDQRYDKTLIPIEDAPMENGENAVSLGLGLSLRNIDMDAAGNLKVNAWLKATWKDYRLSWEPVEYEGIKKLNLPADMIWRPDISIYNQAFYNDDDADKQLRKSDYNTILTADGTVIWIPPGQFHGGLHLQDERRDHDHGEPRGGAGLSHHDGLLDPGCPSHEPDCLQTDPVWGDGREREDRHERLQHEQPLDRDIAGGTLHLH